ncbi:MAG: undecaprenyl-diphosphate phosphatase [Puniceicoccaceae bacterium]
MKVLRLGLCWVGFFVLLTGLKGAETNPADAEGTLTGTITYRDAVILGLVEGISEYLPISSTGHLILFNHWLGLDQEIPLRNAAGEVLMIQGSEGSEPFTLKKAADGYAIIIQGGAILAVAILYWRRLVAAGRGGVGCGLLILGQVSPLARRKARSFADSDIRLSRNLLLAFLPAVVIGLLLDSWIEEMLFGVLPVVIALIAGAFLMWGVEIWRSRKGEPEGPDLDLPDMTIRQCLLIGFLQCVAMWPGTSRSMMTIVGGYLVGLKPARAAEFSFLLGFITLSAASGYRSLQMGGTLLEALPVGPILVGIAVATVSAAIAVRWLVGYLTRHGLGIFALYRVVLGGLILISL